MTFDLDTVLLVAFAVFYVLLFGAARLGALVRLASNCYLKRR
jgi:hypothetical protein